MTLVDPSQLRLPHDSTLPQEMAMPHTGLSVQEIPFLPGKQYRKEEQAMDLLQKNGHINLYAHI